MARDNTGRVKRFANQLASMRTCAGLERDALSWLGSVVTEAHFAAGDKLILEGATDRDCYFLVEGEVEVEMGGKQVGKVGPGEVEGEIALLYRQPRSGTTTALTDTHALKLKAEDFDFLSLRDPNMAQAIADAIIERLVQRFNWRPPPVHFAPQRPAEENT